MPCNTEPQLSYPWAGETPRTTPTPQCRLQDLVDAMDAVEFRQHLRDQANARLEKWAIDARPSAAI